MEFSNDFTMVFNGVNISIPSGEKIKLFKVVHCRVVHYWFLRESWKKRSETNNPRRSSKSNGNITTVFNSNNKISLTNLITHIDSATNETNYWWVWVRFDIYRNFWPESGGNQKNKNRKVVPEVPSNFRLNSDVKPMMNNQWQEKAIVWLRRRMSTLPNK